MVAATDIVGTVGVDVIPIAPLFHEKLRAIVLPGADKIGEDLGAAIGRTLSIKIAAAIPKAISEGAKAAKGEAVKQGSSTGGAFADSLRAKLVAAFRAMPKLDVKMSDVGVDAELARLRAKLEQLSSKRIGIDVSVADAEAKVQELDDRLARLGATSVNPAVRVDVATARAALADITAEIRAASASPLDIRVRVSEFEADLVARVEAAQAALPVIEVDANTDPARQAIDRYRAELETIPVRLRTDVNFNITEALAKIAEIRGGLEALKVDNNVSIDVRVDAARAEAELAVVAAEADALTTTRRIDIGTSGATGGVLALGLALASLAAPAIPAIIAGAGGILSAFTAAAAGVGAFALVAAPGLKNVSAALQAQTAASNQSTKATNAQTNAGVTAAQQALTMASAQQALASAERSAASSIRSADEQIANAQRAVAQAVQTAADQRKQALAAVVTAEHSLADAQRSEQDAQENLTSARATAAQQLLDLDDQLRDSALTSEQAQLSVQRAYLALLAAKSNRTTDPLALEEAQLAYDQAIQSQKEQTKSDAALKKSAAEQKKAGVDGNAAVKSAAEALAKSQEDVAAKTQAVADAEENVGKVAKQAAQQIADAQRSEADAYASAADARANAADSIASAERGIQSAQLSASKATGAATTAADAYQKALAKLSPSARELFDAIAGPNGLKTAFSSWSRSLQPEVLPLFTRGVDSAKNSLPGLTPLVLGAAGAITTLYDDASRELKSPFWVDFKKTIDKTAGPAIVGLGKSIGNVFKGSAGIVDAFLKHIDGVNGAMTRITGRFANWGVNLKDSDGFKRFLQYVTTQGPKAAQYIGKILSTALDVLKDIQPVTEGILGPILSGLSWIATNLPEVVKLFWGLYLITKLLKIAFIALEIPIAIYNVAMALADVETTGFAAALASTGISEIILAIEAVVVLLGLALYELWTRAGWFRKGLEDAWTGIKVATLFLWHDVFEPMAHGISAGFKAIGDAAVWLWQTILSPTFNAIWYAVRFLVTVFLTLLITPVYLAVKYVLAPVFTWLYSHAVKPAIDGIAQAASWLWRSVLRPVFQAIGDFTKATYRDVLKPVYDAIKTALHQVGDAASWLYKSAIKPIYQSISDRTSSLWEKGLKPTFQLIKDGVGKVADAFKAAKKGIKSAWDDVGDVALAPVKVVVNTVYNDGIVPVWNAVSKVTGVDKIKPWHPKGYATGGVLPGYTPGRDVHRFTSPTGGAIDLSGGEAILRPEVTRVLGPAWVSLMNNAARNGGVGGVHSALGGVPAFSGGGILGGIGDILSGQKILAHHATGGLSDYLADPSKTWDALTKNIKSLSSKFGNTDWDKMIAKAPLTMVSDLKKKALSSLTDVFTAKAGGGDNGAHGTGPAAAQAMARTMLPAFGWGGNMMAPLITLWNQESGWRWNALNPSSGAYGIPQALPAIKMAAAGKDWHTNPHTQMTWGMDYISKRYGNPANAWQHEISHNWYDSGGILPLGNSLVTNGTGKPEMVLTNQQWTAIRAAADSRMTPNVTVESHTYLGDREITDLVDHRIIVHTDVAATALDHGFN